MFICQRPMRAAADQPFRSPSVYGGAATTAAGVIGDYSSSATSTTTNASTTTTECSPTLTGCLGNVMGVGGACLDAEKRMTAMSVVAPVPCSSADAAGGGVRKRQRRRRRPVYFAPGSSIASASPDTRSSQAESRRRRPVQPWHIQQQQQQSRMQEMQCRMANLSTAPSGQSFGSRQRPVTLVDSSWWPVSMPASSVRMAGLRLCAGSAFNHVCVFWLHAFLHSCAR